MKWRWLRPKTPIFFPPAKFHLFNQIKRSTYLKNCWEVHRKRDSRLVQALKSKCPIIRKNFDKFSLCVVWTCCLNLGELVWVDNINLRWFFTVSAFFHNAETIGSSKIMDVWWRRIWQAFYILTFKPRQLNHQQCLAWMIVLINNSVSLFARVFWWINIWLK